MGCCSSNSTKEKNEEYRPKTTTVGSTYPTEADINNNNNEVNKLILNDNKYEEMEETTIYEDEKPFSEVKNYGKILDQKKNR